MKVISAVAAFAAMSAASALKLKLTANQEFNANHFLDVLTEVHSRPEITTHAEFLELSHEEALGPDHGFTEQQVADYAEFHRYNLKMRTTDQVGMHLANFKRLADEEQALLQDEEIEESLLEVDELEGEEVEGEEDEEAMSEEMGYRRRRRRRRRRWKSWRRRRRQKDKQNGPAYSPNFTRLQLWEFLDIMHMVTQGLNDNWSGNYPDAPSATGSSSDIQGCRLNPGNSYHGCKCRFIPETGNYPNGVKYGDAVCLAWRGNTGAGNVPTGGKCALGFRGSDAVSDWIGYLRLFGWMGYNARIFGNPERWSIYVPKAFAMEWDGIQWYAGNLLSTAGAACSEMAFVGASLGGALAEIAYEKHKGQYTSRLLTLDAPKISSKKHECGLAGDCTGCRQGAKYYRAWYKQSLVSAAPNKKMWGLLGTVSACGAFLAAIAVPGWGLIVGAVLIAFSAWCWAARVIANNYHHVTSKKGSFRLSANGYHAGRECRGNPGWYSGTILSAINSDGSFGNDWSSSGQFVRGTMKYHAVGYWMGADHSSLTNLPEGSQTNWFLNGTPSYVDPTLTDAPTAQPTPATAPPTAPPTEAPTLAPTLYPTWPDLRRRRRRRRFFGGTPTDSPTPGTIMQTFTSMGGGSSASSQSGAFSGTAPNGAGLGAFNSPAPGLSGTTPGVQQQALSPAQGFAEAPCAPETSPYITNNAEYCYEAVPGSHVYYYHQVGMIYENHPDAHCCDNDGDGVSNGSNNHGPIREADNHLVQNPCTQGAQMYTGPGVFDCHENDAAHTGHAHTIHGAGHVHTGLEPMDADHRVESRDGSTPGKVTMKAPSLSKDCQAFCALDAIDTVESRRSLAMLQMARGRMSTGREVAGKGGGEAAQETRGGSGTDGGFSLCDCDAIIIDPMDDVNGDARDGGAYPFAAGEVQRR